MADSFKQKENKNKTTTKLGEITTTEVGAVAVTATATESAVGTQTEAAMMKMKMVKSSAEQVLNLLQRCL